MRIISALALIFCLVGCKNGQQNTDAVRQGVIEYLQGRSMNTSAMEITVKDVKFDGNKADATVSFAAKGGSSDSGMAMQYQLEQKNGKWAVTGRKELSPTPHGATAPPAQSATPAEEPSAPAANPHGAAMPAPESLPPAGKK